MNPASESEGVKADRGRWGTGVYGKLCDVRDTNWGEEIFLKSRVNLLSIILRRYEHDSVDNRLDEVGTEEAAPAKMRDFADIGRAGCLVE